MGDDPRSAAAKAAEVRFLFPHSSFRFLFYIALFRYWIGGLISRVLC